MSMLSSAASSLAKSLLPLLRPQIETWLRTRALNLPASKEEQIAAKLGLPLPVVAAVIAAIESEIADYAVSQIDKI